VVLSEEPLQIGTGMGKIAEEEEVVEDGEESVDDDDLPEWARRDAFLDDELARAHSLLQTFLPPALLPALTPSADPRKPFLASLSSGQLLCVAYNSCVRKSKKPWGYISRDGIHDILALEANEKAKDGNKGDEEGDKRDGGKGEAGKKGWTFRRTDNLRLWAGALKLRYMLPIVVPPQPQSHTQNTTGHSNSNTPLPSPTSTRFSGSLSDPPIVFDARVVARKDEGWEDMLAELLLRWVGRVVEERRGVR